MFLSCSRRCWEINLVSSTYKTHALVLSTSLPLTERKWQVSKFHDGVGILSQGFLILLITQTITSHCLMSLITLGFGAELLLQQCWKVG